MVSSGAYAYDLFHVFTCSRPSDKNFTITAIDESFYMTEAFKEAGFTCDILDFNPPGLPPQYYLIECVMCPMGTFLGKWECVPCPPGS